ncbi:MAG TPA: hypothetical protein VF334_17245, partial [Polyangia bacterium]
MRSPNGWARRARIVEAATGPSPASTSSTSMRFCVSVPVLSVQMTVTPPSVSADDMRRTTMPRLRTRAIERTSAAVDTTGSPSGSAATPSATAPRSTSASGRPCARPAAAAAAAPASDRRATRFDSRVSRCASGVSG